MGNSKKKKKSLSSLNRAFGIANRFESLQPDKFKQDVASLKEHANDIRTNFGFKDGHASAPSITGENVHLWEKMQQEDFILQCIGMARCLMLDSWYKKKRVFSLPSETISYILNKFPFSYIPKNLDTCLAQICHETIYIEFTDGYSLAAGTNDNGEIVQPKELMGMFIGQCFMKNKKLHDGNLELQTIGIQVPYYGDPYIAVYTSPNITVNNYFAMEGDDAFQHLMVAVAVYLWFVYQKRDNLNTVFFPKIKSGVFEYFKVLPIPFTDSVPNQADPNSLVASGLAARMGFLSREKFFEALNEAIGMTNGVSDCFFLAKTQEEKAALDIFVKNITSKMILWWEHYRVIYQYTTEKSLSFSLKYLDELLLNGFPERLLKYMPHETLVLHWLDADRVALVSTCDCICKKNIKKAGVIVAIVDINNMPTSVFPVHEALRCPNKADETFFYILDALCTFYHILTVFEQRSLKKVTKDALLAGNPNTTDLASIALQPPSSHTSANNTFYQNTNLYRFGDTIEEVPFELFKVTNKAVVRQQQKEQKIRMGWKMVPHVRRPHPHRYWVGHGANKHLEVRWLDRIQIHKDQTANKTVIHRVQ